jgi:hypothetical protein
MLVGVGDGGKLVGVGEEEARGSGVWFAHPVISSAMNKAEIMQNNGILFSFIMAKPLTSSLDLRHNENQQI